MKVPNTLLVSTVLFLVCAPCLPSEYVEIERVLAPVANEIAEKLDSQSVVVCCRSSGRRPIYWRPHEAIATELTAALRIQGIDAIRYAADHRIASLGKSTKPFNSNDAKSLAAVDRDVLLAATLSSEKKPQLKVALLSSKNGEKFWEKTIAVPETALRLDNNLPELNRRVVEFCHNNLGECVGKGECSTLAKFALKDAKAHQPGIYTWGRELDDHEAVLPGDILQFELAKIRAPGFKKDYTHHTAVVTEITRNDFVVHHQNVGRGGKTVQREEWPANLRWTGLVGVFRPWAGESPLPPVSPRRRTPPEIIRRGDAVDLLKTIDPRLDSVRGMWFWDAGGLKWNRDTFARLQVPITPPEEYTLRLKVRRLFGGDSFGIGIIVGGHQTQIAIDGYKGKITGLNLLDGKKCKNNETTYRQPVIPSEKLVNLEVRVRPDSVKLIADGKTIIDWTGDPSRLSVQNEYSVPNSKWLFLTSWNTQFHLTEFVLEEK